ncbi:Zn(II)2Cys6 transcription factor [Aspergillus saccharolyticus JOP 1030-1]|uniref:Zn(2)-C6 fungal-type domain-containing protein n=1 Tax=Aspergillus saccharolyticus JOP 1030-1 TaxID=1450539 RepID=A0A319AEA3_9EURO|nr:hypothetical protein BP01DRAFT_419926 [Aspergillus saccharolyticus JOP 1030-1]PYH49808.1 hypothetical protein BP01DRAFT_419926 [Aspergillus saccharolyticus JOP 1030-1]
MTLNCLPSTQCSDISLAVTESVFLHGDGRNIKDTVSKSPANARASRRFARRSRNGCRTCRARRVKCDETPGICTNCARTGRRCEYDLHRIPDRAPRGSIVASIAVPWKVTSDERRCLSYFQNLSLPHLVAFFDSPLWQRLILQLCHREPAVFHAVIALGAVHQAHELGGGRLRPGQRQALFERHSEQKQWYLFAMAQSGRAIAKLNERGQSPDPQFQRVILACCLLFIMGELLQQDMSRATIHIQAGLHILQGLEVRRRASSLDLTVAGGGDTNGPQVVEDCVVEAFLELQMCSIFYGTTEPLHLHDEVVYDRPYRDLYLTQRFRSLQHAHQVLTPLLDTMALFVWQGSHLSDEDIARDYASLHTRQQSLIAYFTRFLHLLDEYCHHDHHHRLVPSAAGNTRRHGTNKDAPQKSLREAHIMRLSCIYGRYSVQIALASKERPLPASLADDAFAVLVAAETAMAQFTLTERPAVTTRCEIVPALCTATMRCPDFRLRCRGIENLRAWDAQEGFMNAAFNADLMEELMKVELLRLYAAGAPPPPGVTLERETVGATGSRDGGGEGANGGPIVARIVYCGSDGAEREHRVRLVRNETLAADLRAIEGSETWPCMRLLGLMDESAMLVEATAEKNGDRSE